MHKLFFTFLSFIFLTVVPSAYLVAQGVASENELGKLFIQSLQKKQFKLIADVLVPTKVYAAISPDEALDKSEAELAKMQEVVESRLKSKWDILRTEAKFYKVKTSQLSFLTVNPKEIPFQSIYLSGLEVVAGYQQRTFNFLLIVVQVEEVWYLLDIARQSNIFE